MSNKTTATKTGVVSESSGVKATDNATEAVERGIPLNLPDNAVIGEFSGIPRSTASVEIGRAHV